MNDLILHPSGSSILIPDSKSLFRVTVNLNRNTMPMKAIVHFVKTLQRCLAPRPVRDRRFIEWDLPTPLEDR